MPFLPALKWETLRIVQNQLSKLWQYTFLLSYENLEGEQRRQNNRRTEDKRQLDWLKGERCKMWSRGGLLLIAGKGLHEVLSESGFHS